VEHNIFKIHCEDVLKHVDFIEIFNSRCNSKLNLFAFELQKANNIHPIIATDAHVKDELLNTYFIYNEKYEILEERSAYAKLRNVRLSQLVKYYKEKNIKKIIKYIILYIIGK
jgi:hypothetical protein